MTQVGHDLSHISYQGDQSHDSDRITIVVSKWNPEVTETMYNGAVETLVQAGVKPEHIVRRDAPGSFELPLAAQLSLEGKSAMPDAVICIGCVIQGETRHFDFICEAVANGITNVGLKYNTPVIFGVLTPDTQQQALDRAGGKYGNKGNEAATAALDMIDLKRSES